MITSTGITVAAGLGDAREDRLESPRFRRDRSRYASDNRDTGSEAFSNS